MEFICHGTEHSCKSVYICNPFTCRFSMQDFGKRSEWHGVEGYKNISLYTPHSLANSMHTIWWLFWVQSILLGIEEQEAMQAISSLKPVEGRFEWIKGHWKKLTAVIDYVHTDDAVEKKILQSIRSICIPQQRIITVIGCGGNRDRDKKTKNGSGCCVEQWPSHSYFR